MLIVGQKAPSFIAESTKGMINLNNYLKRQPIVLIFYPGDDTSICTAQLCAVRDSKAEYEELHAFVVGINSGSMEEHHKFSNKFLYDFPLISDSDEQIHHQYNIGKILWIRPNRIVYVIDLQGNIAYARKGNRPTKEIFESIRGVNS